MVAIELAYFTNKGRTGAHDGDCASQAIGAKHGEIGQLVTFVNGRKGLKFADGRIDEIEENDEIEVLDSEFQA